jgi:hypothetical protein
MQTEPELQMSMTDRKDALPAKHSQGPWMVQPGHKRGVFTVVRDVRPGFVQYLNAKGEARARPSRFRSLIAANAAIAKATGEQA